MLSSTRTCPRRLLLRCEIWGHDVVWVREVAPGSADPDVLSRAQQENRLLVTLDKDFGELAVKTGVAKAGVILLRIAPASAERIAGVVVEALASQRDWSGKFAVVENGRIRIRSLTAEKIS